MNRSSLIFDPIPAHRLMLSLWTEVIYRAKAGE